MKETIGDLVYERDALPCPFCGYEPEVDKGYNSCVRLYCISCKDMRVATGFVATLGKAVEAWNRRTSDHEEDDGK